mmetsp:Transcript_59497/g.156575  ORF Transcript_59497/g.156575 Transcript_59497/m.156575 type:complete len:119 (-) Transcript_59497:33-389(-)
MDLKDIPDRWKRFNPETPPYKFFPNRTRKQTMMWSWMTIVGTSAFAYILYALVEKKNDRDSEKFKEYARTHTSIDMQRHIESQQEALQAIFMKARRQRLGLPGQVHGSVEIVDPNSEE